MTRRCSICKIQNWSGIDTHLEQSKHGMLQCTKDLTKIPDLSYNDCPEIVEGRRRSSYLSCWKFLIYLVVVNTKFTSWHIKPSRIFAKNRNCVKNHIWNVRGIPFDYSRFRAHLAKRRKLIYNFCIKKNDRSKSMHKAADNASDNPCYHTWTINENILLLTFRFHFMNLVRTKHLHTR